MKTITLTQDGRLEHIWLAAADIPSNAISISDDDVDKLLNHRSTKRYDVASGTVVDFIPPYNYQSAINNKQAEINAGSKSVLNNIISQYTREEIDSWPVQEAEANAWSVDNSAETPLLDSMLSNRPSVDKVTLVSRILTNAANYKAVTGAVIGKKQAYEDTLYALDPATATQEDIDAIVVQF